jgi:hypothetical protein
MKRKGKGKDGVGNQIFQFLISEEQGEERI